MKIFHNWGNSRSKKCSIIYHVFFMLRISISTWSKNVTSLSLYIRLFAVSLIHCEANIFFLSDFLLSVCNFTVCYATSTKLNSQIYYKCSKTTMNSYDRLISLYILFITGHWLVHSFYLLSNQPKNKVHFSNITLGF